MRRKTLALYFDGTWNRADQVDREGTPRPTNITKLFEATLGAFSEDGSPQIVHYVQGIGTRRSERIRGGGFGLGISENIKEGYRFLVSNYEPGDRIFIFGFSRGAYTARSLAGMIRNVGIVRREHMPQVNDAYSHYKDKTKPWRPNGSSAVEFRTRYSWGGETITFLGVFDTVGALGAPFGVVFDWIINRFMKVGFHDTQLSNIVEHAYHAVAVDERRLPFQPTLMMPNTRHNNINFEQRWFAGAHSDVGGGYTESGLSDLALTWMAGKANLHGLSIDLGRLTEPACRPDVKETPHNSMTFFYHFAGLVMVKLPGLVRFVQKKYASALPHIRWNGEFVRPIPRVGNIKPFLGTPPANSLLSEYDGDLHESVIEKMNRCGEEYQPANVVDAITKGK